MNLGPLAFVLRRLLNCAALLLTVCTLAMVASPSLAHDGDHKADGEKKKKANTLGWKLESSHAALAAGDSHFYLRLRVKAAKVKSKSRKPLNLALVFDRSGSMANDSKIGYVRKAGHLVVKNLTPKDYVALVAYNHAVQTLVPMHPVVNREYLHHRIDELRASGQTNLSGGLLEGCAQLHKRLKKEGLHHLILLTDGLANRGVTEPGSLVRLVSRCTTHGITVSTIGVGTDYNESLLGRMARAGGGRYTYVAKPEQIPTALKEGTGVAAGRGGTKRQAHHETPLRSRGKKGLRLGRAA